MRTISLRRSARRVRKYGTILMAALLALLLTAGALGGCAKKPAANTAVVRYRNQDAVIPMTIENVVQVKTYIVHGELYQVVVYEKDALTPIVFTSMEIVDCLCGDGVEQLTFEDKVYHTYDPFLQGIKSDIRKTFIMEKYAEYFGRAPSEQEYNEALEKLIEKVQLKDLEVRLRYAPEAVMYRIGASRAKPLSAREQKRLVRMLERGESPDQIVEALS